MKTTVTLDGIVLEVEFNYCDAEPENGAPEQYDIINVYYADAVRKDLGYLFARGDTLDRITKELEKQKGDI